MDGLDLVFRCLVVWTTFGLACVALALWRSKEQELKPPPKQESKLVALSKSQPRAKLATVLERHLCKAICHDLSAAGYHLKPLKSRLFERDGELWIRGEDDDGSKTEIRLCLDINDDLDFYWLIADETV